MESKKTQTTITARDDSYGVALVGTVEAIARFGPFKEADLVALLYENSRALCGETPSLSIVSTQLTGQRFEVTFLYANGKKANARDLVRFVEKALKHFNPEVRHAGGVISAHVPPPKNMPGSPRKGMPWSSRAGVMGRCA